MSINCTNNSCYFDNWYKRSVRSIPSSISIGTITDRLIDIITEQIAYKHQHLALLRRECSLSNEYCVTTGLYAVVGACVFLGRVSRMTVSLVVIMSEVIDSLSYIVPLIVYIALTAKWIGDAFGERIYEENIKSSVDSYLENHETFRYITLKVGEAIRSNHLNENLLLVCIYQDSMTIPQIDSLVQHHSH